MFISRRHVFAASQGSYSLTRESISLFRRVVAEAVGTALLLTAIVGSGIMGERLAGGNVAISLSIIQNQ